MTPPETTPSTTEQFAETLTSLAQFGKYFTDDAKIEELVSWVHEETNLNKVAIRLAIKHVAPLLLAVAAKAGTPVASAWLGRLHDRLSNRQWYFHLSQTLLNTLKTRTDKTLEQAFDIPATANLEALITDRARWENLKPEQQGLVQLLLGQNQISEALDISRQQLNQQLDKLLALFSFRLDLKTPESFIADAKDARYGSSLWLTYAHRQAGLVGREGDLQRLADFLDQEAEVSWWVITGAGGIGKSRLALEFLLLHQNLWEVGRLSKDKLCDRAGLDRWRPLSPTLMVIDYAAEYPDDIGQWLDHLIRHQQEYDFPVRLLILERYHQEQEWWKKLAPATTDGFARQQKLYTRAPLELSLLTRTQQREALHEFLRGSEKPCELPAEGNPFWESLHTLSDKGRPLFIGMVAVALATGGNSVNAIRNWTTSEDLLKFVLAHEQDAWKRLFAHGNYTKPEQERISDLLAISTVTAGLEWERNEEANTAILLASGLCADSAELSRFWQAVCLLTGNGEGTLQPDIFAEYFVLRSWQAQPNQPSQHRKKMLSAAHQLAPANTRSFIARCATDYPQDKSTRIWWDWLRDGSSAPDSRELLETAFAIASQLHLQGQSRLALAVWLPPLLSLADPQLRARALNLQGVLHLSLGEFAAALPPLQEALTILQEIGDRSGEGTTLNNISQIYDARGDYATALAYLEQSLTIRQEIGDRSGFCATLFNIGHIHLHNKEPQEAMRCWATVYQTAREIGEAQVLTALAGLAEQLDLPSGLDGWERVVQKKM